MSHFSVLLLEDDDPLRACLAEVLAARGCRVYPTAVGQEAVELARNVRLDFSILDLHLRGMTGLEVLARIHRQGRRLPSIMMSGDATREEAAAARRQGVFEFLYKPFDLDVLRQSMDQLIHHHFGRRPGDFAR